MDKRSERWARKKVMGKRDDQRREADLEECRQAIARLSDAELCETLLDVPHRKWIEIEKDTHMAIGIIAHRAAQRIAELTQSPSAAARDVMAERERQRSEDPARQPQATNDLSVAVRLAWVWASRRDIT